MNNKNFLILFFIILLNYSCSIFQLSHINPYDPLYVGSITSSSLSSYSSSLNYSSFNSSTISSSSQFSSVSSSFSLSESTSESSSSVSFSSSLSESSVSSSVSFSSSLSESSVSSSVSSSSSLSESSSESSSSSSFFSQIFIKGSFLQNPVLMTKESNYIWNYIIELKPGIYNFRFDDTLGDTGIYYGIDGWNGGGDLIFTNNSYLPVKFSYYDNNKTYQIKLIKDGIFVSSILGDDNNNNGLIPESPVKSINKAIEKCIFNNKSNIFVMVGEYSINNGGIKIISNSGIYLNQYNNNYKILGGWDYDFIDQNGFSIINFENNNGSVVKIENTEKIYLNRLIIINGNSGYGGGIFAYSMKFSEIDKCIISNNIASSYGAGIYFYGCNSNIVRAMILNNTSPSGSGGGIYLINSTGNLIESIIKNNHAGYGDGTGLYIKDSIGTKIINSSIIGNSGNSICKNLYFYGNSGNSLFISNNIISCGDATGTKTGIVFEMSSTPQNFIIVENKFNYLSMTYLFKNYNGSTTTSIDDINSTSFTGATIATGNIISNF